MSRMITVLLLLLVFFFGGMSYGSFEKERISLQPLQEIERVDESFEAETTVVMADAAPTVEEGDYFVHKTASFFETIVTSVYEIIINILYAIANLFFD